MICPTPIFIKNPNPTQHSYQYNAIPCGTCAICLTNRRVSWAIRILEESKNHKESIFVTLTYETEPDEGVTKEELKTFIKNLREKLRTREGLYFRYYALGEYGTKTKRSHYHLVLFGLMLEDIDLIRDTWGKGHVTASILNEARAFYITKYHVNRGNYPTGKNKSFTMMSTKPGIGYNYLERMERFHNKSIDNQFYSLYEWKMPLPRYLRDKLYTKGERATYSDKFRKKFEEDAKNAEQSNKDYFKQRFYQIKSTNRNYKLKSQSNETI